MVDILKNVTVQYGKQMLNNNYNIISHNEQNPVRTQRKEKLTVSRKLVKGLCGR